MIPIAIGSLTNINSLCIPVPSNLLTRNIRNRTNRKICCSIINKRFYLETICIFRFNQNAIDNHFDTTKTNLYVFCTLSLAIALVHPSIKAKPVAPKSCSYTYFVVNYVTTIAFIVQL